MVNYIINLKDKHFHSGTCKAKAQYRPSFAVCTTDPRCAMSACIEKGKLQMSQPHNCSSACKDTAPMTTNPMRTLQLMCTLILSQVLQQMILMTIMTWTGSCMTRSFRNDDDCACSQLMMMVTFLMDDHWRAVVCSPVVEHQCICRQTTGDQPPQP